METTVKAITDGDKWVLDILTAPFGSPVKRDSHKEYFDIQTDFAEQYYPLAPLVYYHGYETSQRRAAKPIFLGHTFQRDVRVDGVWYKGELDKRVPLAQQMWDAALKGQLASSPGTAEHLRRASPDGHLDLWPILEISIFETSSGKRPANPYAVALPALKAVYQEAGLDLPESIEQEAPMTVTADVSTNGANGNGQTTTDIKALIADAIREYEAGKQAQQTADQERQAAIDAAVKAERDRLVADFAANNRLPDGANVPVVLKFAEVRKYDNLDAADTAVLIEVLGAANEGRATKSAVTDSALRALAIKLDEDKTRVGEVGRNAMKAMGLSTKANEVMQQSLVGSGKDWVGVAYSQAIWDRIRLESFVAANLPSIEVPQGADSITLPLEGADPIFYKVAEATSTDATGGVAATVKASKAGTDNRTLNVSLMGARVLWTGSMEEDSLIPFVPQLRSQLSTAGMEQFEHALIDGDVAMAATTNINNIGGTPAADDLYTLFDGFRKLALVTNTTNSRAGAALALSDFLNTVKLMGPGGINGLDRKKVGFLVDALTYYAAMQLTQVQTRDLYSNPTIEGGELTGLYGYRLRPSGQMCRLSGNGLSNIAGKVDQTTPANNTKGSILAVRWDQWMLGYKRRMTTEVTRIARADANEIVCLMRVGLKNRDAEGASLTYNLTV